MTSPSAEAAAAQPPTRLTIVVASHVEKGHLCASFSLARRFRSRGHRVIYFSLMDAEKLVLEQGFEFVPFAEDILPEGSFQVPQEAGSDSSPAPVLWWRRRLTAERLFQHYVQRCSNGHVDARLLSCSADVLICDTLLWYVALRALSLGIPTLNFSSGTHGRPNPRGPPSSYSRIPNLSWWGGMQVRADWLRFRCTDLFTTRLASTILGRYRNPRQIHRLIGEFRKLAKQAGVVLTKNRTYWRTEFGPSLMLPEIALSAGSFEFEGTREPLRSYTGELVDADRTEDTSLLDRLDAQKPLVYCTLGSAANLYPHSRRFFRSVIGASKLRPDWQWVLSIGARQDVNELGAGGASLLVTKWAPQLAVLRRAAVMVSHGGINSVLECIHFSVPMVILPGLRDQPGTMARAVHHGIAVGAGMNNITPERLVALVETAMHNPALRLHLLRMKDKIAAEAGMARVIALVEGAPGSTARQTAVFCPHSEVQAAAVAQL